MRDGELGRHSSRGGGGVVGAGMGVVEGNCVKRRTPPNRNTCHGLRFIF